MKTRNTNKSYLWMKKYMKTHKTSVFENTVYFCIKHNLSGNNLKRYLEWAGGKSLNALSSKDIKASIDFEHSEETRRMFPEITDEMFCLGQGENRQVDVESHDRFYPVYYYKGDMRNLATVKHGTLKYQEGKDKVTFSIFFHKIYSKESECHPISICLYQHWDKQSWVFSSNEKIGSFVKYCMLLYETIKRLDGTDEIDTTKPISKKIGNWVRPLTPSEKKQQKKKQLFNTLNKKSKVGSMITCPVCGKRFFKKQYSQSFCSLHCKDSFWNSNQKNKRQGCGGHGNLVMSICSHTLTRLVSVGILVR